MKNLLSENMMRFGTKNLSEAAQKELVLKSIMETIDQHGLQLEVRQALTEADQPKPGATIELEAAPAWDSYKKDDNYDVLVAQSPSAIGKASKILGTIMKLLGSGKEEDVAMRNVIKQITPETYPAILWMVRFGSSFRSNNKFKSNFKTVSDWLSNYKIDQPAAGYSKDNDFIKFDGRGPIVGAYDFIIGTKTGEVISSVLSDLNGDEKFWY